MRRDRHLSGHQERGWNEAAHNADSDSARVVRGHETAAKGPVVDCGSAPRPSRAPVQAGLTPLARVTDTTGRSAFALVHRGH
jgi:hypothetical protein